MDSGNSSRWDRRRFLVGAGAVAWWVTTPARGAEESGTPIDPQIAAIEKEVGGRIGLAALDTGNGRRLTHRETERFAMASTFKWMLAAFVLAKVDKGELTLAQPVPYGPIDLLPYAPVTEAHVKDGKLTVEELAAAAVEFSDNGAANLLLKKCGGPAAFTHFLRSIGDDFTRLDRTEMSLNSNLPGDPRDTSTPAAMIETMRKILLGNVLLDGGKARLLDWLKNCATGKERLGAGLPKDWVVGDKTGSGENGAINDLVIACPPPPRVPILIVRYMSDSKADIDKLSAAHAKIATLLAAAFG